MKTKIPSKIETIAQAKAYLKELVRNGESYHPDESAETIITGPTYNRLFTDEEAKLLNERMDEVTSIRGFDPCEYLLMLDEPLGTHVLQVKRAGGGAGNTWDVIELADGRILCVTDNAVMIWMDEDEFEKAVEDEDTDWGELADNNGRAILFEYLKPIK